MGVSAVGVAVECFQLVPGEFVAASLSLPEQISRITLGQGVVDALISDPDLACLFKDRLPPKKLLPLEVRLPEDRSDLIVNAADHLSAINQLKRSFFCEPVAKRPVTAPDPILDDQRLGADALVVRGERSFQAGPHGLRFLLKMRCFAVSADQQN